MILPRPSYSCPDCTRKCTSASGLTRHHNASHRQLTPTLDDEGDDAGENFTYRRHPNLTGKAFLCFLVNSYSSSLSEIIIQQSHVTKMEIFSPLTLLHHDLRHHH